MKQLTSTRVKVTLYLHEDASLSHSHSLSTHPFLPPPTAPPLSLLSLPLPPECSRDSLLSQQCLSLDYCPPGGLPDTLPVSLGAVFTKGLGINLRFCVWFAPLPLFNFSATDYNIYIVIYHFLIFCCNNTMVIILISLAYIISVILQIYNI